MSALIVETVALEHKGGTKQYNVVVVVSVAEQRSLVIFRWGRIGAFGEIQVHSFDGKLVARRFADKKIREKQSGGYGIIRNDENQIDQDQLARTLTPMLMSKLTKDQVLHICPDFDVKGMRDAAVSVRTDEDGNFDKKLDEMQTRRRAEEGRAAVALTETQKVDLAFKDDPRFGAF